MPTRHLGLRAQIVLSLAALLSVVFSFTAIAMLWVARGSLAAQRRDLGSAVARAVAARIAERVRADGSLPEIEDLVATSLGEGGIVAIGVYDSGARLIAQRAISGRTARLDIDPRRPRSFELERWTEGNARELVVVEPVGRGRGAVAVIVALEPTGPELTRAAKPVIAYLISSGLLLLAFGYFALTRVLVQPLEVLTRATDRVASGNLSVTVPIAGGREIAEAARSFNLMTVTLRAQKERLDKQLRELESSAQDLRAAQDQLVRSAKLASVGSLAAGLAHEVGNPVSAILGLSEVLLDGGQDPAEAREYLERIRREADRVNRIIRDLLEYARPSPEGRDTPASVSEATDAAVGLLAPQKAYRDIDVQVAIDEGLPPLKVGLDQLVQVLVNLLMNAAEAMGGKGEVRIRATVAEPPTVKRPASVRISVSDSGPGVRPEEIARIFEPFFTTKDPGRGTGLGLAICEGIVARAGGSVAAANLPSGGFEVSLTIPAADGPKPTASEDR